MHAVESGVTTATSPRSGHVEALHAEILAERSRLAELESSLRHFVESNAQQSRHLESMRAQNADLSLRISSSVGDRSAAEARLARYRQDAQGLESQQSTLDAVSRVCRGAQ